MFEAGSFAVRHHPVLGSTNDEAMRLARAGERGPSFVVATRQTGGRGRHGRSWASPPGNLYASLLLCDPAPIAVLPQLGLVAGVSLAVALRGLLQGDDRIRLKWPNDVLFDGAKLAGLLLESATLPDGRLACVIGFGVNCRSHPDGLAYPASDLTRAAGHPIEPEDVLAALAPTLRAQIDLWDRGANFPAVRQGWLALAAGLGATIQVACPSRTVTGLFQTLDASGRLLVETSEGCVAIDAGDVFLHG